jgi:hypothetical protein
MSIINKTTLKTSFENGDIPDQDDFANLIDSYAGEVDSSDNRTIDAENRTLYKSDGASKAIEWSNGSSIAIYGELDLSSITELDSNITTLTASNTFAQVTVNGKTFAIPLYTF